MSKLYLSESGKVIPIIGEELTDYRRARKIIHIPYAKNQSILYFLARAYPETNVSLQISVNGTELSSISPNYTDHYIWYEIPIDESLLKSGANTFEFWADNHSMNSWSLAFEDGHKNPKSFVSADGGQTWRNEKMGYLNVSRCEYIVRLRISEGKDPAPPVMIWEDLAHPRIERIRALIPKNLLKSGSTLMRARLLLTWVSTSWEYRNSTVGAVYAPWDVETILAWGKAGKGHAGKIPIVMCVHYGVAMVSACMAIGIPARCTIVTEALEATNGHFVTEVWSDEFSKWVMLDPNLDAMFFKDNVPLSVEEIRTTRLDLRDLIVWGPGYEFHKNNPLIQPWIEEGFLTGNCFLHRSIWPRTDFLSSPEQSPPGHGTISCCETNLVWETQDLDMGFGMFPFFGDKSYFNMPPVGFF